MIALVDNYDSFTYNLYQLIGSIDPDARVIRNDACTPAELAALGPTHVVLSPGPGRPEDAGICVDVVRELGGEVPILGICLGHQAICVAFGASVGHARAIVHGKRSTVSLDVGCPLFEGLPDRIPAARYHSLAVDERTMPAELLVTAHADDGEVMAVRHRDQPTFGLQFHPESIMTPDGSTMLANFLAIRRWPRETDGSDSDQRSDTTQGSMRHD